MLKMGSDELGSTSGAAAVPGNMGNMEENTLIAALCDLIERIWSHARSDDVGDGGANEFGHQSNNRCPFWSHLTAFHEQQQQSSSSTSASNIAGTSDDSRPSTPSEQPNVTSNVTWLKKRIDCKWCKSVDGVVGCWCWLKPTIIFLCSSSLALSQLSLVEQSSRSLLLPKADSAATRSIPSTLCYDFKSIRDMTDIKTDVGKSRAFIRLSLERKLLSKHLRTLLYNQELLQ